MWHQMGEYIESNVSFRLGKQLSLRWGRRPEGSFGIPNVEEFGIYEIIL